ncbi:hypothetical protein C4572_02470 [Candidatus Parcubacteria bacterium]|nr:MAG: hypothetical protein C4572_02470 [Candidatus Parcubacteria bacterium]
MQRIFLALLFILLAPVAAGAVGIGVRPSDLNINVSLNQQKTADLIVYNLSAEPAVFDVYSDELNSWITIAPNNFRLEAEETKVIKITVNGKEAGRTATNISVVAKGLNKRLFNADSGIKVPLKINVTKNVASLSRPVVILLSIGAVFVCLVSWFMLKFGRKPWYKRFYEKLRNMLID